MSTENTFTGAPLVGDNLALDFINTKYVVDGKSHDCFSDDKSIANWLKSVGLLPDIKDQQIPTGLLTEAREFRDMARNIVYAAMNKTPVNLGLINRLLETGRPTRQLEWDEELQKFRTVVYQSAASPSGLLWPIADALINLVTSDKFEFVRQCEAHDCILLFHDLSKSHRRRWCSMATCGNRMKVAAFRSRKKP